MMVAMDTSRLITHTYVVHMSMLMVEYTSYHILRIISRTGLGIIHTISSKHIYLHY